MTQLRLSLTRPAAALLSLLIAVCLAAAAPASALAATLDTAASGSITLDLQYDGQPVAGGSFALYKVGEVSEDGTSWVLTEDFASSGVDLAALLGGDDSDEDSDEDGIVLSASAQDLSRAAETLAAYAAAQGVQPIAVEFNVGGTVVFSDLSVGVYLVVQVTESEGYELMAPFLITVPMSSGEEDDVVYVYDVNAYGKFTLVKKPPVPEEPEDEEGEPEDEEEKGEEETPVEVSEEEAPEIEVPEEEAASLIAYAEGAAGGEEGGEILAQTGQLNWPIPVLAVCGMMLMALGFTIDRKNRAQEDTEIAGQNENEES